MHNGDLERTASDGCEVAQHLELPDADVAYRRVLAETSRDRSLEEGLRRRCVVKQVEASPHSLLVIPGPDLPSQPRRSGDWRRHLAESL
jgi:hypothetical protein